MSHPTVVVVPTRYP